MSWAVSTTNGPVPPVATEEDDPVTALREPDEANEEHPPDDNFMDATVEDVSVDEDGGTEEAPSCEAALQDIGNSKTMLFSMALGMVNPDGSQLIEHIELNYAPYAAASSRRSFVPKKKNLLEEVLRRARDTKLPTPKCKNWNTSQLVTFLRENPISNPIDLVYVKGQLLAFEEALKAGAAERTSTNAVLNAESSNRGAAWSMVMWLRLAHALAEDVVKQAFLQRHSCDDREVLDARNSGIRPPTWDAVLATKFNDKSWVPHSVAIPSLHDDFASSFPLPFDEVVNPILSEQVKSRVADVKAKMVIVRIIHGLLYIPLNTWIIISLDHLYLIFCFISLQIVSNYEESGRGDGSASRMDGERDFGRFDPTNLTFEADNRAAFLLGFKTHVLYFWHFCDTMDILASTLCVMDQSMTASINGIPIASELNNATKRKHSEAKKAEEEDRSMKRFIGESFRGLTVSSLQSNLGDTRKEYRQLKREWYESNDPEHKEFLNTEITKVLGDIESIERQLTHTLSLVN